MGCRTRATRQELLRVVAIDSGEGLTEVVPDPDRRRPGRGAHLHPTPACLALALRRRAFPRALRVSGRLASGRVEEYVAGLAGEQQ
ncbi:YlxR family protein [Nocardioides iriomotensis]|uniref:YlxR family protein n=1 Tax=Nocardioides iriomotensis TaxID=715784 RepID=UPI001F0DC27D|nr:YlxR family protein [Nocardioides iriomotensis]